jgi:hypothetical protein
MTPIDRMILDNEKKHYRHAGNKEQAIRDEFDMSPTRYYQRLANLLDEPEAVAAEPLLVNRLRRIRDQRAIVRRGRVA